MPAARYPSDCVPAAGMGIPAIDSFRRDEILQRGCEGDRPTAGLPRCCASMRDESGRRRHPVSPRGSRGRQHGRIPVGFEAEASPFGNGARGWRIAIAKSHRVRTYLARDAVACVSARQANLREPQPRQPTGSAICCIQSGSTRRRRSALQPQP